MATVSHDEDEEFQDAIDRDAGEQESVLEPTSTDAEPHGSRSAAQPTAEAFHDVEEAFVESTMAEGTPHTVSTVDASSGHTTDGQPQTAAAPSALPRSSTEYQAAGHTARDDAAIWDTESDADGDQHAEKPTAVVLTEEEWQRLSEEAEAAKKAGNDLYAAGDWAEAMVKYSLALETAPPDSPQRSVYFANRAVCHLKLEDHPGAVRDCTAALDVDPGYVKALMRRSAAYEAMDDLERALADAQKVLSINSGNASMAATVKRLEPIVAERREKMKEEMMGKLKELGNTVLGKFGLSLDNFKAEKDPNTGGYSIQFKQ